MPLNNSSGYYLAPEGATGVAAPRSGQTPVYGGYQLSNRNDINQPVYDRNQIIGYRDSGDGFEVPKFKYRNGEPEAVSHKYNKLGASPMSDALRGPALPPLGQSGPLQLPPWMTGDQNPVDFLGGAGGGTGGAPGAGTGQLPPIVPAMVRLLHHNKAMAPGADANNPYAGQTAMSQALRNHGAPAQITGGTQDG